MSLSFNNLIYLRKLVFAVVLTFLNDYPDYGCLIMIVTTIWFLVRLVKVKPYKWKLLQYRDFVVEVGFAVIYLLSLLLEKKIGQRKVVGNLLVGVFWVILLVHLSSLIYLVIRLGI